VNTKQKTKTVSEFLDVRPRCDVVMRVGPWQVSRKLTFRLPPCRRVATHSAIMPCCGNAMFCCDKHQEMRTVAWYCPPCEAIVPEGQMNWQKL
jgi:hypothetical protein